MSSCQQHEEEADAIADDATSAAAKEVKAVPAWVDGSSIFPSTIHAIARKLHEPDFTIQDAETRSAAEEKDNPGVWIEEIVFHVPLLGDIYPHSALVEVVDGRGEKGIKACEIEDSK